MESIEDIIGQDRLKVMTKKRSPMRGQRDRIREMEIFDSLSQADRDKINYSNRPITPSLFKMGYYDNETISVST